MYTKKFKFERPLVESDIPPADITTTWVLKDETKEIIYDIRKFINGMWTSIIQGERPDPPEPPTPPTPTPVSVNLVIKLNEDVFDELELPAQLTSAQMARLGFTFQALYSLMHGEKTFVQIGTKIYPFASIRATEDQLFEILMLSTTGDYIGGKTIRFAYDNLLFVWNVAEVEIPQFVATEDIVENEDDNG